jgi:hypothetical protein
MLERTFNTVTERGEFIAEEPTKNYDELAYGCHARSEEHSD